MMNDVRSRAASELGLSGLEDLCAKKRGAFLSRVRRDPIPFSEVVIIIVMSSNILSGGGRWYDLLA